MAARSTKPETVMEMSLVELGIAYEKQVGRLPGTPDFVITDSSVAVFVHGCYWHRHDCPDGNAPTRKFDIFAQMRRNFGVERDSSVQAKLNELGFTVFVAWECDLKRSRSEVASILARLISKN